MKLHLESKDIDFHQLVENSLNSIWIVGQEGKILYYNKACLDLFHLKTSKDIISKGIWLFLHPDFHDKSRERLRRILENQEVLKTAELKMLKSNGEEIDVEVMSVPFFIKDKVFAQVTMQNITHRKAAEKLLNNREKLASLGQIAAGIAHEVKNPLTSVKGFLQLIKESQSHPYLDIMENELMKALAALQNLLQVSKPDLHDEPLVSIDLCNELASLIYLFQDRLYKVDVELDLRDSEKKIVGKRNLFQKAFFNLLKNSLEAIEDKGKIRIEHYYKNDWIHIKVTDSGIGIPKEKLKMLGTPFFTSKTDGTGLGLTQVFTTVHEHQGNIFIQSEVGKGTTIHVQLPLKEKS
ncbi:two-component system sensor histidine kinase NtrB [Neobacillus ginsengisoli]|uniref:histidine kinase n=1 Tax=Neobacillus ginsengisoli TaxID=904295 RepID=A0ABT9Y1D7_9BACI|nr:ATP-binding protein [Neobacillus ginsengisoli]MDQ0201406.1 two-component system sporulation sensor kinase A [Neobacillus ginsengisoli]